MSALAGSTGAETRMEERASAAEKAFNGEVVFCSSRLLFWELHTIVGLDFGVGEELNFGFKMGFERFVGMVRDMFVLVMSLWKCLLSGKWEGVDDEEWSKGCGEKVFRFFEGLGEIGGGGKKRRVDKVDEVRRLSWMFVIG